MFIAYMTCSQKTSQWGDISAWNVNHNKSCGCGVSKQRTRKLDIVDILSESDWGFPVILVSIQLMMFCALYSAQASRDFLLLVYTRSSHPHSDGVHRRFTNSSSNSVFNTSALTPSFTVEILLRSDPRLCPCAGRIPGCPQSADLGRRVWSGTFRKT